jgi:tRNA A-37 threonylcarbamoyl transferase component Bud32
LVVRTDGAAGVREGEVLAGKYRIDKVLGAGGMGVVVAAHHVQLDERVALKFLLPEALQNADAVARFVREARAAVKIKNEHVATVKDVGTLENGAPYMVMEYLEGGDLAAWLKQRGALPVDQAVEFILQACVAVADAHALGIVHRDLKPANLFCVRRSDGQLTIKVLDFGISKVTDLTGTGPAVAMTHTRAFMGSPLYMSPEQMQSARAVDARSDIWALGVVLFELLAGRAPFLSESIMELGAMIAKEAPPSLRSFRPDAPADLEAIVLRCLEKDPARRFANVGELAIALLPFGPRRAKGFVERISGIVQAGGLSRSALEVPETPLADGTQVSEGTLPPTGRTTTGAARGRPAMVGAVAALLAVCALGVGTFVLQARKGAPADSAPASAATAPPVPPPSAPVEALAAPPADPAPAAAPPASALAAGAPVQGPPKAGHAQPQALASHEHPAAATPAASTAAVRAKPAGSTCAVVRYFDDQGGEHFKEDCH